MSRRYRIDIELTLDTDYDLWTPKDSTKIKYEVLPYLFFPSLTSANTDDEAVEEFIRDVMQDCDIERCWFRHVQGKEKTSVECQLEREFSAGYNEKGYEADVLRQIERLQKELPFAFEYKIKITYVERDPDLVIEGTNIPGR